MANVREVVKGIGGSRSSHPAALLYTPQRQDARNSLVSNPPGQAAGCGDDSSVPWRCGGHTPRSLGQSSSSRAIVVQTAVIPTTIARTRPSIISRSGTLQCCGLGRRGRVAAVHRGSACATACAAPKIPIMMLARTCSPADPASAFHARGRIAIFGSAGQRIMPPSSYLDVKAAVVGVAKDRKRHRSPVSGPDGTQCCLLLRRGWRQHSAPPGVSHPVTFRRVSNVLGTVLRINRVW